MLGLGLRGLERARQDSDLGISDLGRHLGVGEVLVDNDTLDQDGILESTTDLAVDLDQLEVDVLALQVGDRQDGVDGHVGELVVCLGHNLTSQTRVRDLEEVLCVGGAELDNVGYPVELRHCNVASLVVTVCDTDGVDSLVDQLRSLLEQGTGQHDNTSGSVTNLVILRLGQLDQQLCYVIRDLHLLQDGGAIVGDCDIAVGGDENLVETARTEGSLDKVGDGAGGEDVRLDSFVAVLTLLLALAERKGKLLVIVLGGQHHGDGRGQGEMDRDILSDDDEGPTLLILRHHSWSSQYKPIGTAASNWAPIPLDISRSKLLVSRGSGLVRGLYHGQNILKAILKEDLRLAGASLPKEGVGWSGGSSRETGVLTETGSQNCGGVSLSVAQVELAPPTAWVPKQSRAPKFSNFCGPPLVGWLDGGPRPPRILGGPEKPFAPLSFTELT